MPIGIPKHKETRAEELRLRYKIARILRKVREDKLLTREAVESATGISERSLRDTEQAVWGVDFVRVVRLADFYKIDLNELANAVREKPQ